MTTAAAIDRLVHHCICIELNVPSYRMAQAQKAQGEIQLTVEILSEACPMRAKCMMSRDRKESAVSMC